MKLAQKAFGLQTALACVYPILQSASQFITATNLFRWPWGSASSDTVDSWQTIANKIFDGDELTITWVTKNGPADKPGLVVNDKVIAFNNVEFGNTLAQHNSSMLKLSAVKPQTLP